MKKKPIRQPMPQKPRRLELIPPEDLSPEELEAIKEAEQGASDSYRQGNFLILHSPDEERAVAVDLNGKTVIHHLGSFSEITAIVTLLQGVKSGNQRVYENTFADLTDDDFLDEGLTALDDIMPVDEPLLSNSNEMNSLVDMLRDDFLDQLIKPPKKKS